MYVPFISHARRQAFTLIELLLVIVIIGVLTAIVAPQFSAGIGGTRLQVEARAIAQAERYARTMALLHQAEVELTIATNNTMRVDAAPQAAEDRSGAKGNDIRDTHDAINKSTAFPVNTSVSNLNAHNAGTASSSNKDAALMPLPEVIVTSDAFAGAIHVEHVFDRVTVRFLGYTDSESGIAEEHHAAAAPEGAAAVCIRFRSNGTCRPHRFRLEDASGAALEVQIDLLGSAKIDSK